MLGLGLRVPAVVVQRLADDVAVVRDADGAIAVGVAAVLDSKPVADVVRPVEAPLGPFRRSADSSEPVLERIQIRNFNGGRIKLVSGSRTRVSCFE